jgi:uncharacterized membrane protein
MFISNIIGIAIFMFIKSILSRFEKKIKNSITDERCMKLTDALSRHYWDSCVMQWAVNNFLVSVFVFFQRDSSASQIDSKQLIPLAINTINGAL